MKIIIEEPLPGEEDSVVVRCREISPSLMQLLSQFQSYQQYVIAYQSEKIHRIPTSDIYYFEAVNNKVFVYEQKNVYESRQKLYEVTESLSGGDFIRVSKSIVLNLTKIKYIAPAFNGRFEATLNNGEKIIISRQFVPALKKKLNL